jgi:hypothetical protein
MESRKCADDVQIPAKRVFTREQKPVFSVPQATLSIRA